MICTPQQEAAITAQLVALGFYDHGLTAGVHGLSGVFADIAPYQIHVGFQHGQCLVGQLEPDDGRPVPLWVSRDSTIAVLRTILGALL